MSPKLINGVVGISFVLIFQMAIIAAAQTFPILAPLAAEDFGIDATSVGYFSMVVFAAALLSSNGTAGLLRRWGSVRCAAITLAISGIGVLILAASNTVLGLMVAALVLGLAYGPVNPAGSRLLIRVSQGYRRNLVFSIKQTSVAIGGAAAGALLPLVALPYGWRAGMVAMAVISFSIALVAFPVRAKLGDDGNPEASPGFQGPFGPAQTMLADPSLRALALSIFAFSAAQFGLMSIYVTFLWSRAGLSPVTAAWMLSIALGTSVTSRLFWGWLADTRNPIRILAGLAVSGVVAVLAMLLLSPGVPLSASILVSMLLGVGPLGWSGVFLAEIAQEGVVRGGEQAVVTITAGMMVFGYLGGMLGPGSLSLSVAAFGGYGPGTAFIAVLLALTAIALARQDRTLPKTTTEGPPT